MDEDEIKAGIEDWRGARQRAQEKRDTMLRKAHAEGWGVMNLMRATGLSRETIRLALNPEKRPGRSGD